MVVFSQLGAKVGDRGAEGRGERARSALQPLTHVGVPESCRHRLGHLIPCARQYGKGIPDLLLGRPRAVGNTPVCGRYPLFEVFELRGDPIPRIGLRVLVVTRMISVVRLHLLDGTYELFRAHFGRRDTVVGQDGSDLRATLGILESTLALLREPGVTHLAASFDTVVESFRNDMFSGYKTSIGMEEELLAQFPLAERALEAIGVTVWRNVEFEADDALATAAIRWVEDTDQVVVVSPDKDLTQVVVGDRIVTYNRREQRILDEKGVVAKFGVHPESIPDYLALVGDAADGVPGLSGWGAKSSSTVLARYPRLELIPPNSDEWEVEVRGAAKLAATFIDHQEEVYLYRELTTLRLDVPLTEELEDLEWQGVPRAEFVVFCSEMGLDADVIRVDRWAD